MPRPESPEALLRLAPEWPLPPYSYVSGHNPHPFSHPEGHSYGAPAKQVAVPDPVRWHVCPSYLYGIDLFNFGFYWEAHETWEALWHACGRKGLVADFLKGLIRLAAAGVKVREGRPEGVRSHGARARHLFRELAGKQMEARFMGLPLADLAAFADLLAERPETFAGTPGKAVEVVFPFTLVPAPFDRIRAHSVSAGVCLNPR